MTVQSLSGVNSNPDHNLSCTVKVDSEFQVCTDNTIVILNIVCHAEIKVSSVVAQFSCFLLVNDNLLIALSVEFYQHDGV